MFNGFDFAVPAIFVSVCTVVFGGFFTLIAWGIALVDNSANKDDRKFPIALYTFTVSLLSDLLGMAVLSIMPYEWQQSYVMGMRLPPLVYSAFMIISFTAVIISMIFLRKKRGKTAKIIATGSVVLIIANVIGFAFFIMSLPGMPLH